jgi:FAD/FMN-containing dehydrogenase
MTTLANAFTSSDSGWDEARTAWNLAVDQQPDLVVVPETVEEVAAAVRHAADNGLAVAPQGPGHAAGAHPSLAGVMLLRTIKLTGVEVDPDARTARVQAGSESAELAEAAGAHGLSALGGSSPDVGVAGYTLGGGIGWLGRAHGLACNRIVGAEVITAEGDLRRVDADNDPELLWALKGGGGAFAVVVSLDLELVPAGDLYGGLVAWPVDAARDLLAAYREWTADLADEVTPSLRFLNLPPLPDIPEPLAGNPVMAMTAVRVGDEEEGREALAPMLEVAEPVMNAVGPLPPAALSRIHGDPEQPVPGIADGFVLERLEEATTDALLKLAGPGSNSPLLAVELRLLGGALSRAPENAGALATVHGAYTVGSAGMAVDVDAAQAIHAHQAGLREAVGAWASERSYLNFAESIVDTASGFEPDAYRRLQEIKKRVDPDDVIRSDHPIPPAA